MGFKDGDIVTNRGKLYPVFIADDGNMYSVLSTEEQVDLLQILIPTVYNGDVKIYPTPLNEYNATMKLLDKNKLKK